MTNDKSFVTSGDIQIHKTTYGGWPNCIRLANDQIELIVTTDVGPRIMRFGFIGSQNFLKEFEGHLGKSGGDEWRIYGGHRLWHAPEAYPRTYAPDNDPVEYERINDRLKLKQQIESMTGIVKEIEIALEPNANRVTIKHRLTNMGEEIELAPWALTAMAQGGRAILPQEPYRPYPEVLLPVRSLVLWSYTNMSDPRWRWGAKYIQLRQDPETGAKQKFGILNTQGWGAYYLKGEVFIKKFPYEAGANYPDFGCNTEVFTDEGMLELESLGPLTKLQQGDSIEHTEQWYLFRAELDDESEDSLDKKLLPRLIAQA